MPVYQYQEVSPVNSYTSQNFFPWYRTKDEEIMAFVHKALQNKSITYALHSILYGNNNFPSFQVVYEERSNNRLK